MYVKSVIIDGFKSYGNRVEINGFDPQFNAITGLNGTGKSNILDAICFVLGISNLSQVRATSLTDLVYKSGQAGIKKASVTIVFDNRDQSRSPVGFEAYEEITVTRQIFSDQSGRNRYMLNGATVQNKRVIDLFNSVQLNVNNPHFLIMQGRITKVLNMKPPEILGMIEEAAGTRMYEMKKQAAQKTIEKKDLKLSELNSILQDEIGPRIERLKKERFQYFELQKVEREYDQLHKIHVAYTFLKTEEIQSNGQKKLKQVLENINSMKENITTSKEEILLLDKEIEKLQRKRDEECGGRLGEIEEELKEAEKFEAVVAATSKTSKSNVLTEEKKLKQMEKSLSEDKTTFNIKQKQLNDVEDIFNKMKEEEQKDLEAFSAAKKKYQAVSSGLFSNNEDGSDATLQDQLMQAKGAISQAETDRKQAEMQIEYHQDQLKIKEAELKKTKNSFVEDQKQLDTFDKKIASYKEELNKMSYEDGLLERLMQEKRKLINEIRPLEDTVANIENRNPRLNFQYKDPEPNFRRNLVKGLVCKLFKSKDKRFQIALESAAGGRLYNVIVENEEVSKMLIQHGQLRSRTTFVPLNKIRGNTINDSVLRTVKNLIGPDKAFPAITLVDYNPEYRCVMEWLFGDTFVCVDNSSASKITFHNSIRKKCVTLDGDSYDPSGMVSGGAPLKQDSILNLLSEVEMAENLLSDKRNSLNEIINKIKPVTKQAECYNAIKQQLELQDHQLEILKQRIQQTSHYQQKEEIETLKANIETLKKKIQDCLKIEKENAEKVIDLEKMMKNIQSVRDSQLKAAEIEMKRLKKKSDESRNLWQQREQEFAALKLEIEDLKKAIENGECQIETAQQSLNELKENLNRINEEHEKKKEEVSNIQTKLKNEKENINQQNKEIKKIMQHKDELQNEISNIKLKILKEEGERNKLKEEFENAEKTLKEMIKKYDWIEDDKVFFGKPNGLYDFDQHNPKEVASKLPKLQELKAKLSRAVNTRAVNLLGKEEEQFQELIKKKEIVEADKAKIVAVIKELEEKKNIALKHAWEQVNRDFGSIFGKLLPGANAKLSTLPGKTVLDGLEVKVAFGNIWKESLGELSGGQRSLVALSFILAMLLFKPAPIYILDEVDAALDLSHTQNIGQMLKAHFTHSQFIVVSLKEGMFNNANVIFRTKFVDGMSHVQRTTLNRHS
ncbi:hypothetical protein PGB90_008260 [Kerria lacca]